MSETIDQLRKQASEIRNKIDRIESVERFNSATKLIGKCYRYRNCYSCPQSDDDYWWLYSRVVMSTKDGHLIVFSFQVDRDGKIEIAQRDRRSGSASLGDQITLKQFQHAWRVTARMINNKARDARALA